MHGKAGDFRFNSDNRRQRHRRGLRREAICQVAGVSGLSDTKALSTAYGTDVVDALPVATTDYPTMENVIAQKPDVMLAGWNYGYSEEKKLTPDLLADRDIAGYVLSESCRQADGKRGTMPPWEALSADIDNLGKITGRE